MRAQHLQDILLAHFAERLFDRCVAEKLVERLQYILRGTVFILRDGGEQHAQKAAGDATIVHLGNIVRHIGENRVLEQGECTGAVAMSQQGVKLRQLSVQCAAEAFRHEPGHLADGARQAALDMLRGGESAELPQKLGNILLHSRGGIGLECLA